eukprot:6188979-Pleurochrysis_carterae.AAC.2
MTTGRANASDRRRASQRSCSIYSAVEVCRVLPSLMIFPQRACAAESGRACVGRSASRPERRLSHSPWCAARLLTDECGPSFC